MLLDDDGWVAPRRPGTHRPLRLRLRPRLPRRAARALRVSGPHAAAAALRARQLVEPLPPLHRRRVPRADGPLRRRGHAVLASRSSTWTGTWSTSTRATAAAGPATPGTATCSPTRRRSSPSCTSAACAVTLNVHPADGVHAHEDALRRDRAARWASTPAASCRSPSTSPTRAFLEAYFEELHHPLEDEGVDFWWLDWQQGGVTRASPGIDPLWMLNHFHFLDSGARRQAAADVLPLRRHRQPPLPGRLLRRHPHHLGVAGLPAVVHRDRVERRLRLVEPRHRRPLLRLQGRRAGHPLGAARRVLADPAAALRRSTRSTPRSRGGSARGRSAVMTDVPAAAAPAAALPAHDEPPRAPRRRAARAADVLRPPGRAPRPTTCRTSSCSAPSCWSRRSPRPRTARPASARSRAWLPAGTWIDVFTGLVYAGGRDAPAAPRPRLDPGARPGRRDRAAGAAGDLGNDPMTRRRSRCGRTPARTASSRWSRTRDDERWARTRFTLRGGELRIHAVEGDAAPCPADRSLRRGAVRVHRRHRRRGRRDRAARGTWPEWPAAWPCRSRR